MVQELWRDSELNWTDGVKHMVEGVLESDEGEIGGGVVEQG